MEKEKKRKLHLLLVLLHPANLILNWWKLLRSHHQEFCFFSQLSFISFLETFFFRLTATGESPSRELISLSLSLLYSLLSSSPHLFSLLLRRLYLPKAFTSIALRCFSFESAQSVAKGFKKKSSFNIVVIISHFQKLSHWFRPSLYYLASPL